MKKLIPVVAILLIMLVALCACNGTKEPTKIDTPDTPASDPTVVTVSDTTIVFAPTSNYAGQTLLTFMQQKKQEEKLDFTFSNSMVTSINGTANTADYSKCWMLYTSDANMANTAWGTVEYNGEIYGSAILGAEELVIIENGLYIWVYTTF